MTAARKWAVALRGVGFGVGLCAVLFSTEARAAAPGAARQPKRAKRVPVAAPPPSAEAASTKVPAYEGADAVRFARLDKTLATLGQDSGGSGTLAVLGLVAGAVYTGIGVFIAVDSDQEPRDSSMRGLVVTESLIIGGFCLGLGADSLSTMGNPSSGTVRYARFRRDYRAGKLTLFKLGQYEGELYRDALTARANRRSLGFLSFGVGAAGAGLIVLAATSDMRGRARTLTYMEGGAFLPLGTIAGIFLLNSELSQERQWRLYRRGASATPVARWSVLPVLTPHGVLVTAGTSL